MVRAAIALVAGAIGDAGAATRYFMLQDVAFDDGTTAVGSVGVDFEANEITGWNVRVKGGDGLLPFTYVPGNSSPEYGGIGVAGGSRPYMRFTGIPGGSYMEQRRLMLVATLPLDGSATTVPVYQVDPVTGANFSEELWRSWVGGAAKERNVVAGSLVLVPFPPPVGLVDVIEFHHGAFDHYFISADPVEINALDTGYFTGWARTGHQFKAYATGSSAGPTMNPVCRYYGLPSAGLDSHFYSADAAECFRVNRDFGAEWQIESDNVFQIDLPNATTGACPGGTVPVYRVFNHRPDANHRYMTSTAIRAQMEAAGWIREGYGPNATIMCATSF
jgi:hypothetical protein